jgi:hypothetical protein
MKLTREQEMDAKDGCLVLLLNVFALLPLGLALKGYVIAQYWTWFIMPRFHQEPLSLPHAIGLALFATVLTRPMPDAAGKKQKPWEAFWPTAFSALFTPAVSLLIGWVVFRFTI